HFRVSDSLAWVRQAHGFLRAKNLLIELQRARRIFEAHVRHCSLLRRCHFRCFSAHFSSPYQIRFQNRLKIFPRQPAQFLRDTCKRFSISARFVGRCGTAPRENRVNLLIQFFLLPAFRHFSSPRSSVSSNLSSAANSESRETVTASPRLPFFRSPAQFREYFSPRQNASQSPAAGPPAIPSPTEKAGPALRSIQNRIPRWPLFLDFLSHERASAMCRRSHSLPFAGATRKTARRAIRTSQCSRALDGKRQKSHPRLPGGSRPAAGRMRTPVRSNFHTAPRTDSDRFAPPQSVNAQPPAARPFLFVAP